ncbi:MAG: hypothetical protein WEC14_08895 [Chloroflexota bacterium]
MKVTLESGAYTQEELEAQASQLEADLRASGYTDIATGVDLAAERVFGAVSSLEASSAFRAPSVLTSLHVPFDITYVDGPVGAVEDAYTYGGRTLKNAAGATCTTGFSAKIFGTSTDGFLTAGHCSQLTTYVDPSGGIHAANLKEEYEGNKGDFAYFDVPSSISRPIYYTTNTASRVLFGVAANADIDVGDWLCVYGRATNATKCGTVHTTSISCNGIGQLVLMNANLTTGGDSGGPWWTGNTGYGIHHGKCNPWGLGAWSAFSRLYLFDDSLGAKYDLLFG